MDVDVDEVPIRPAEVELEVWGEGPRAGGYREPRVRGEERVFSWRPFAGSGAIDARTGRPRPLLSPEGRRLRARVRRWTLSLASDELHVTQPGRSTSVALADVREVVIRRREQRLPEPLFRFEVVLVRPHEAEIVLDAGDSLPTARYLAHQIHRRAKVPLTDIFDAATSWKLSREKRAWMKGDVHPALDPEAAPGGPGWRHRFAGRPGRAARLAVLGLSTSLLVAFVIGALAQGMPAALLVTLPWLLVLLLLAVETNRFTLELAPDAVVLRRGPLLGYEVRVPLHSLRAVRIAEPDRLLLIHEERGEPVFTTLMAGEPPRDVARAAVAIAEHAAIPIEDVTGAMNRVAPTRVRVEVATDAREPRREPVDLAREESPEVLDGL